MDWCSKSSRYARCFFPTVVAAVAMQYQQALPVLQASTFCARSRSVKRRMERVVDHEQISFLLKIIRVKQLVVTHVLGISSLPVLRISTNTSDQRCGKDHHVSGKEDGRKRAPRGRRHVQTSPNNPQDTFRQHGTSRDLFSSTALCR